MYFLISLKVLKTLKKDCLKGFLKSVNAKLENKRFTENAPEMVIQNEIKKKDDAMSKISVLTARLNKLEN